MAGRRSQQSPSINRLTSPPETIPSCYRRSRHAEFQPHHGRHLWPICSPQLLPPGGWLRSAADLEKYVLVHSYWSPSDIEPPTWQRWLAVARRKWRSLPDFKDVQHLSFREELHAIEAVIAGQGIGIFSNVLVASELASGTLVKAFDLSLPGYRFYVVRRHGHPREKIIRAFSTWLRSVK